MPKFTAFRKKFLGNGQGAILIGAEWDEKIPTWPLLLKKSGYHLGYTYKVWSPGNPRDAGIGGSANAYRSAGGKFNGFSQYVFGRSERMATAEKIEKAKAIKKTKNELYREVRGNFNGFLDKRNKDQPFVYWFGPH